MHIPTPEDLIEAAKVRRQINALELKYRHLVGLNGTSAPEEVKPKISEEGRKKLARIARMRWAKVKKEGKKRL